VKGTQKIGLTAHQPDFFTFLLFILLLFQKTNFMAISFRPYRKVHPKELSLIKRIQLILTSRFGTFGLFDVFGVRRGKEA
jgi:hypothetical protein